MQQLIEKCYQCYIQARMNLNARDLEPLVVMQLNTLEESIRAALNQSLTLNYLPEDTAQLQNALDKAVERVILQQDEIQKLKSEIDRLNKLNLQQTTQMHEFQFGFQNAVAVNIPQLKEENDDLKQKINDKELFIGKLNQQIQLLQQGIDHQNMNFQAEIQMLRHTIENVHPQALREKDRQAQELRNKIHELEQQNYNFASQAQQRDLELMQTQNQIKCLQDENTVLRAQTEVQAEQIAKTQRIPHMDLSLTGYEPSEYYNPQIKIGNQGVQKSQYQYQNNLNDSGEMQKQIVRDKHEQMQRSGLRYLNLDQYI